MIAKIASTERHPGASGFSFSRSPAQVGSGGEPMPGKVSTPEELLELCKVVAEFKRGYFEINSRILVPSKEEKEREEDFEPVRSIARET